MATMVYQSSLSGFVYPRFSTDYFISSILEKRLIIATVSEMKGK
jgi:hypothetical protein